uniref:Type III restriction enzyme, res subunit n=1 Tax=mine drainage metagenome TaxID=410659 RepID=E6PG78_9ZZZZ
MDDRFFKEPILNSPYDYPACHWELDDRGQPTGSVVEGRRKASFITPIPSSKKKTKAETELPLGVGQSEGDDRQYLLASTINDIRARVDEWRSRPNPATWGVTPETQRLLQHWRSYNFSGARPFFCQVEAVETAIWLAEVAPQEGARGKSVLDGLAKANAEANPELMRAALKLATGAGKTTVMAMIIAWQTINAVRHPQSKRFTRGFLVVAPGLTIKDRLRVLKPNDPDSYYRARELVPADLLAELGQAEIVVTNYHAFKLRERLELSKGGRALLQGRGEALNTLETEGQMLQRVMPELMGLKNILVLNDEAHHCYREKPNADPEDLKGEELKEAEKNAEAARVWISGLEIVSRKIGVQRVIDLSATPFFLSGSGYREGTLFPWTVSDFSLMDAIECGIVKLPRVPITDNLPGGETPMFRNLWEHIGKKLPKKNVKAAGQLDPQNLPPQLVTALTALYGHYAQTYQAWADAEIRVPPCFIIVCNNTATSKLVYDFVSGYTREAVDGSETFHNGRFELFRNYSEHGEPLDRPNTLLIDSEQLESGELDDNFRKAAAAEIERFRREIVERSGDQTAGDKLDDVTLLREVMNTVGKEGRLGGSIRCVVSVSMLTEGWDANTVTHVLGVRAFGTQLLCEQVIGRALRRQSYDLNDDGRFNVEYADVLGVPFDFTAKPVPAPVQQPKKIFHVHAVSPDRDALTIRFPRVAGYRIELPTERFDAQFTPDSVLTLTPELIGPTETLNSGIVGEQANLNLKYTADERPSRIVFELTSYLMQNKWEPGKGPQLHLFGQFKRIVRQWLDSCLECKGGTFPAQLGYATIADMACDRIIAAIVRSQVGEKRPKVVLDPYTPEGSTASVNFYTSKDSYETDPRRSHLSYAVLDSGWEGEFCRVVEEHPLVRAYVKNQGMGFEVPYRLGSEMKRYIPDFIVRIDDGHGENDLLNLVAEVKGYRREDAKDKKDTMDTYWIPGVNTLGTYGRWAFAEFREVFQIREELDAMIDSLRMKASA